MSDFCMPSMGADMDQGTLLAWKVKPGDTLHKGQVIATVDTSKVALDIEVFEDGVLDELLISEGDTVAVGTPIARIRGSGEAASPAGQADAGRQQPQQAMPAAEKKRQVEKTVPLQAAVAATATAGADRKLASPAARRQAKAQGIDLAPLGGSGPDGAVLLADLAAGQAVAAAGKKAVTGFDSAAMRKTIAAAMSRSKREIPHFYLASTVDLHAAEQWLADYNSQREPAGRLLLAALLMKAVAAALAAYPALNGFYRNDAFVAGEAVHLGMAINLRGGGLVAPAILNADQLALPALMAQLQDLVKRARSGGLKSSEISSPTATVTALGERGVDSVFGVIYPPQVAMIGIGRPRRQPVAVDEALAVHLAVDISLAADHRVCDGHLGGLFLNDINRRLQQPEDL